MRHSRPLLAVLLTSIMSIVGLSPQLASAAPCCSAPICQRDIPPPICGLCSDCAVGTEDDFDYEHDFDDEAGLCYAPGQAK